MRLNVPVPASALAVAAHPDDVEFGAGGTLATWAAEGCVVHHLVLTDGAKGTWDLDADPVALAAALSLFLRRLALRDAHAAAYAGERWLEYLDVCSGGEDFRRGVGRVLIDAPFRAHVDYDSIALIAVVRRFTRSVLASRAPAAGAAHA